MITKNASNAVKKIASVYDFAEGTYSIDKPLFSLRPERSNITYTDKNGKTYKYTTDNVAVWRNIAKNKKEFNELLDSGRLSGDDIARIITNDPEYASMVRKHLSKIKDADWNKVFHPMTSEARLTAKPVQPEYSSWRTAAYDPDANRVGYRTMFFGYSNPFSTKITKKTRMINNFMPLFQAMDDDTLKAEVLGHELNHASTLGTVIARKAAAKVKDSHTELPLMRDAFRGSEIMYNRLFDIPASLDARKGFTKGLMQGIGKQIGESTAKYEPLADDILVAGNALDPYSFHNAERIQAVAKNTQALYAAQRLVAEKPELFKDFDKKAVSDFLKLKAPATSKKQFVNRMEFFLKHPEFSLLLGEGSRLVPVYNELKTLKTMFPKLTKRDRSIFNSADYIVPDVTEPSMDYEKRVGKDNDKEYNRLLDMYFY